MYKILFSIFFLFAGLLSLTQPVFAQSNVNTCDELQAKFQSANIGELTEQFPKYCSTGSVYNKVLSILNGFIAIFGVVAIIYGGYVYMLSRGNAAEADKGKRILTWAVVGTIVAVLATVIVNIVVKSLQDGSIF